MATAVSISLVQCKNSSSSDKPTTVEMPKLEYPKTAKLDSVVTEYFGVKVADPYRWLEDPDSKETQEWVKAQNEVTHKYLAALPARAAIKNRLSEIWNYEKFSAPFKKAGKYYYFKNDGVQNHSVLYSQDKLDGTPKIVLNPNEFSKDGTIALGAFNISKDGKYLAYSVQDGGSDWQTGYVLNLETGEKMKDELKWLKFTGLSWQADGFYYNRYPEPQKGNKLAVKNEFSQLYYHKIGTAQTEDKLVHEDKKHANWMFGGRTTEDQKFLILETSESTSGNAFAIKNLAKGDKAFTDVIKGFDNDFSVIDNIDDKTLLVLTNYKAPNYKIVAVDMTKPQVENWKDLIPQAESVLEGVSIVGGKLVAQYLKDVASQVKIFSIDGKFEKDLKLPGIGVVGAFSGEKEDDQAFYTFSSFTVPPTIYEYSMKTGESKVFKESKVKFDVNQYETKQVFVNSKDGTKVPMFITHKKGLKLDGSAPTLLYGYGGFNISVKPNFALSVMILLENGGIYAVANMRGGGEYGEDWHKAGTKMQKQNVFDDFIAAAEYLIKEKYTSSSKLAIEGRSNGGLLIGACMTQRPDLFGVCLPGVGVLDMLRYHQFTIGAAWATDYGRSDESKEMFEYLYKYSPVHNAKPAKYPATMVFTADHDDRVVPAHSYKFISALQAAQQGSTPTLIRIDTRAGHGAGKSTEMVIEELADKWAFTLHNLQSKVIYK